MTAAPVRRPGLRCDSTLGSWAAVTLWGPVADLDVTDADLDEVITAVFASEARR